MSLENSVKRWKELAVEDLDVKAQLAQLTTSSSDAQEWFGRELSFGTGGLRGILGAGTSRMNIYTVRKATQGLANYINGSNCMRRVAIAYDSRIKSDLFAREAARVFAGNDIEVFLYPRLQPTPALSWAVRYLSCGGGVCVTASHNPGEYNGYKVYGADGCQITLAAAEQIQGEIAKVDCFDHVSLAEKDSVLIHTIPEKCLDAFLDAVQQQSPAMMAGEAGVGDLKVVYTPLNGAGRECVERILDRIGVSDVILVPEQAQPDGNFPTCPYPNPEIRQAMQKGIELSEVVKPDLLLGTDPDCDRMGAAVPDGMDGYQLITGNEMGVLMLDYICKRRGATNALPQNPVAVTTIVSTDLLTVVANKHDVELRRTLTGFKFIGEQIGLLEAQGQKERFIFGCEESYGYLSGAHVRDKDAVNASMLACEMTAYYKAQGKGLLDVLEEIYQEFGYYQNDLCSVTFSGAQGMEAMEQLMDDLRKSPPQQMGEFTVERVVDYANATSSGLPAADVLEFRLAGGAKLIIRPSGTEPKIKVYSSAKGESRDGAQAIIKQLSNVAQDLCAAKF